MNRPIRLHDAMNHVCIISGDEFSLSLKVKNFMLRKKLLKLMKDPSVIAVYLLGKGLLNWMDDEQYLKIAYRLRMKKRLNLDDPKSFNEKLQWLKLYNRRSEYTVMVDKYAVRQHVADTVGAEYLIPLIGVWNDPKDIDFSALPDQFVLKCNHNSGLGMCVCKDKSALNIKKARSELRKGMRQDFYLNGREWPYKNVPRKIVGEKYMADESGIELKDYKIYCFDGRPEFIQVMCGRRRGSYYLSHYSLDWQPIRVTRNKHKIYDQPIPRPAHLDEMIDIARKLSDGIPYVRIDLYYAEDRVFFGEMTFYPSSGYVMFSEEEEDLKEGGMIKLPAKRIGR